MAADCDLGKLVFRCEKYPPRECVWRANGGWVGFLPLFLFYLPVLALLLSGFIAAGLGWPGGNGPPGRAEMIGLWVGLFFLLLMLMPLLFHRNLRFAESVAIDLYEHGIEVRTPRRIVRGTYAELAAVYFGTRSRLAGSAMAVSGLMRLGGAAGVRAVFQMRLTIDFGPAGTVRIPLCLAYFKHEAISRLLEEVSRNRPDLVEPHEASRDGESSNVAQNS